MRPLCREAWTFRNFKIVLTLGSCRRAFLRGPYGGTPLSLLIDKEVP